MLTHFCHGFWFRFDEGTTRGLCPFRKGTNYAIYLSELTRNLSPATDNTGNPTTTGRYTAGILPGTNEPIAFVVQDPQNTLGTNQPWSNFPTSPNVAIGT